MAYRNQLNRGMQPRPLPATPLVPLMANQAPLPQNRPLKSATTIVDRCLLLVTVVLLPLEEHIPSVAGFSAMWIVFATLAAYVLLCRRRALGRTCHHPVFLTAYGMISIAFLTEFFHPVPNYSEIFSLAQMVGGAVLVACLCRDHKALTSAFHGFVLASLWLSIVLYLTSYGALSRVATSDFREASRVREEAVINANPLRGTNANTMAAQIAQGVAVAFALLLTAKSTRRRYLFLAVTVFCLVAAFLPMSRGGIVIAFVSCATVMFASGVKRSGVILTAGAIAVALVLFVPGAVWSRMTFSAEQSEGNEDSRAHVYGAALEHLPEYWATGVGIGNFWEAWGRESQFVLDSGLAGPHNCFIAVTVYWGLAGLSSLIAVVWQAYRCLPRRRWRDPSALCLLGMSISLLLLMMVTHVLQSKGFSLGLGLLVGANRWIWPRSQTPGSKTARSLMTHGW